MREEHSVTHFLTLDYLHSDAEGFYCKRDTDIFHLQWDCQSARRVREIPAEHRLISIPNSCVEIRDNQIICAHERDFSDAAQFAPEPIPERVICGESSILSVYPDKHVIDLFPGRVILPMTGGSVPGTPIAIAHDVVIYQNSEGLFFNGAQFRFPHMRFHCREDSAYLCSTRGTRSYLMHVVGDRSVSAVVVDHPILEAKIVDKNTYIATINNRYILWDLRMRKAMRGDHINGNRIMLVDGPHVAFIGSKSTLLDIRKPAARPLDFARSCDNALAATWSASKDRLLVFCEFRVETLHITLFSTQKNETHLNLWIVFRLIYC